MLISANSWMITLSNITLEGELSHHYWCDSDAFRSEASVGSPVRVTEVAIMTVKLVLRVKIEIMQQLSRK